MRYKVGDRVMVHNTSFILKNSKVVGGYHTNVGDSEDNLVFNNAMFRYCGEQAIVIKATIDSTEQYQRYELDISKDGGWVWSKEMLREVGRKEEKEMQKRIQEENKFKEELL